MINKEVLQSFVDLWSTYTKEKQEEILDELLDIYNNRVKTEIQKEIMEEVLYELQGKGFVKT